MDPIGIIDESYFSLSGPRCCDDTAPNMPAALREAGEWLAAGATKITLCTTRWDPVQGIAMEGEALITLEGHEALWPDDEDDE